MDPQKYLETLRSGKYLALKDVIHLFMKASEILIEEPNVVPVSSPASVVGDVHGQFYDVNFMLEQMEVYNQNCNRNYIFLGDYVDRGYYSIETLCTLLVLKVLHPKSITILRGNHECRDTSRMYGFFDECMRKYGTPSVWRAATDMFDAIPVAAVIDGKILCVHGGISPDMVTVDQLNLLPRDDEIPMEGTLCDIMWNDPDPAVEEWAQSSRGTGFVFGHKAVSKFNRVNGLTLIARAHQLAEEGFNFPLGEEAGLVTVWSAPNYMYRNRNKASVMHVDSAAPHFWVFDAVPDEDRVPPPGDFFFPAAFL
ncbi:Calcineurin-like phosphoesterase [Carpediemonas membranifera]|uniref:Serine/threonine-protein phosphatase n=1 Tax=Carpediemonas membranifera TaxID=201153 RepID=A0A8J6E2F5_9EUKA|nr:Calcineurin-like phosphoesterase [Carpediemonas membranifera]|eukprot:KAG9394628.1 Calcineurin-like phosphoesterase [Carpediemonas membranifera]